MLHDDIFKAKNEFVDSKICIRFLKFHNNEGNNI